MNKGQHTGDMGRQQLTEGMTTFWTDSEEKISKDMPVFFNPVMKRNRDLTLAILLTMKDGMRIGLPLEASGVRAARILHELVTPGHLTPSLLALNDLSPEAVECAKLNVERTLGTFDPGKVQVSRNEASMFLRQSAGFDYIDVDPFGTPNPFLDAALSRINRDGIIAVTATDTSALAGTYPGAAAKKYWAAPSRTWVMHEIGMRILVRKVQLIAAQYDKAVVPVLAIATDHYYKIFFECLRSHSKVKEVLRQHEYAHVCRACMQITVSGLNAGACANCGEASLVAGPLWSGPLHDIERVRAMRASLHKLDERTAASLDRLLALIEEECALPTVGFVDLHELASRLKIGAPSTEAALARLGAHACRTHINGHSLKTDLGIAEFKQRLL